MQTYRAATLNIWSSYGPWEQRLGAIVTQLRALAPDVIGLQEVLRAADLDQARRIGEPLGYQIAWGQASEHAGMPSGNAILSRWPIVQSSTSALPNGGSSESRSVVFAACKTPVGVLPVFCTHLNWRLDHGHVRQLQVRALTNFVAEQCDDGMLPALLMGDLNAEPDSDEMRFLRGLTGLGGDCVYYADTFGLVGEGPSATFSKSNPFAAPLREPERRIDYVFVRGPDEAGRGEPLSASRCFDAATDGVFPSDHYGMITTLTLGQ